MRGFQSTQEKLLPSPPPVPQFFNSVHLTSYDGYLAGFMEAGRERDPPGWVGGREGGGREAERSKVRRGSKARDCRSTKCGYQLGLHRGLLWLLSSSFLGRDPNDPSHTFSDGTPDYLHTPAAACRVAKAFPKAKLVAVLRNPVEVRPWLRNLPEVIPLKADPSL